MTAIRADASDGDEFAQVVSEAGTHAPIGAVVHAAGHMDDQPVWGLTPSAIDRVWRSRVGVAESLARFVDANGIGHFLICTGLPAFVATAGQGAFTAAAFGLRSLVAERSGLGLPGRLVAWNAWSAGDGSTDDLVARGVTPLSPDRAMAALGAAVETSATVVLYADVEWPTLVESATIRRSPTIAALAGEPAPQGGPVFASQLADLDPRQALEKAVDVVWSLTSSVLQLAPSPRRTTAAFRDLGADSLTAVQIRNRVGAETGLTLPVSLVFDHPHVEALAGFLVGQLSGQESAADRADQAMRTLAEAIGQIEDPEHLEALNRRMSAMVADTRRARDTGIADLAGADDEDLFAALDQELGR